MKKKFSTVVLSCMVGICMLAYSALPVQAIEPDSCSHPYFALGTDGPTGEYEYLESGHYEVWGTGHACLRCGYEYYTDTHLVWDSDHEWEDEPSDIIEGNNLIIQTYDCKNGDCTRQNLVISTVM